MPRGSPTAPFVVVRECHVRPSAATVGRHVNTIPPTAAALSHICQEPSPPIQAHRP